VNAGALFPGFFAPWPFFAARAVPRGHLGNGLRRSTTHRKFRFAKSAK